MLSQRCLYKGLSPAYDQRSRWRALRLILLSIVTWQRTQLAQTQRPAYYDRPRTSTKTSHVSLCPILISSNGQLSSVSIRYPRTSCKQQSLIHTSCPFQLLSSEEIRQTWLESSSKFCTYKHRSMHKRRLTPTLNTHLPYCMRGSQSRRHSRSGLLGMMRSNH
jgi:hypothetical protein